MRFVLTGNERIGCECLRILLEEKQQVVGVVTDQSGNRTKLENKRLKYLAHQAGIRVYEVADINDAAFVEELRLLAPDVLFNIACLQLYKAPVLAVPRVGCINFHPGPLPRYGGMNGWVWAIINGETEYGVTFHYMKEKIDAGNIIGLQKFPIETSETGLSLLMKCYEHGIALFRHVLHNILANTVEPMPQDLSCRSYYYNKIPYDGMIDTGWNAAKICDFVRAMDFSPFPNPLSPAMISFNGTRMVVTKASQIASEVTNVNNPGEVLELHREGVVMTTGDGLVKLTLSDKSIPQVDTAGICAANGIGTGSILGCRQNGP